MEREKTKERHNALTLPNGLPKGPLFINRDIPPSLSSVACPKQSIFEPRSRTPRNTPPTRPASSASSADTRASSPHLSRIPLFAQKSHSTGPASLSLRDAYRMAGQEESDGALASPSPAPRTWRSRRTSTDKSLNSPNPTATTQGWRRRAARLSTSSLPGRESQRGAVESPETVAETSGYDIDQKLRQYQKDQQQQRRGQQSLDARGGASAAPPRFGTKIPAAAAASLSRRTSNSSFDGDSPSKGYQPWGAKAKSSRGWLKRIMDTPEKDKENLSPERSLGGGDQAQASRRISSAPVAARNRPPPETPNKSFAWQADQDFTANDLQISDSPPVKIGRSDANENERDSPPDGVPQNPFEGGQAGGSWNTKLEEIRALEIEAAEKFPDEPKGDDGSPTEDPESPQSPQSRPLDRTNTKLDEIRAREIEAQSKKALATARLDEIRERNGEAGSRSPSPEMLGSYYEVVGPPTAAADSPTAQNGRQIPDTPVTVFKKPSTEPSKAGSEAPPDDDPSQQPRTGREDAVSRSNSHDLLRRLARKTSSSPVDQQPQEGDAKQPRRSALATDKDAAAKVSRLDKFADDLRPRVGFAVLRKQRSTGSISDKRSSVTASDSDPTERIERELQLFAPMENQSERGSLRVPSPGPSPSLEDYQAADETPRPARTIDPLTQPTPKVTGAYIETPATLRAENGEGAGLVTRGRGTGPLRRTDKSSLSVNRGGDAIRPPFLPPTSRRSRSTPGARSPLINSVRPPTVKDDLREILQGHHFEDATLDNFADMLATQGRQHDEDDKEIKSEDDGLAAHQDTLVDFERREEKEPNHPDHTDDDHVFNRLNRVLFGVQNARRGIENLESRVSQPEAKPEVKSESKDSHVALHPDHAHNADCPMCVGHGVSNAVAYVHLPVPRLWRRSPSFKLTLLGLVAVLLSFWYVAESAMCLAYCRPESCYPGQPCDWSSDDPFWGYAIPVKLDQWVAGGRGRVLANRWGPDVADWSADVWDSITGVDFTQTDTSGFTWDQRRQHRRRLMKRGLVKPPAENPDDRAKHESWRAAAAAKERIESLREMGYDAGEDETMARDEKIVPWW